MASAREHSHENTASQTQPLLPTASSTGASENGDRSSVSVMKQNNLFTPSALALQALVLVFLGLVWWLVLEHLPGNLFSLPLFGYHPLLQSLSLLFLAQSVLVLQPTTQARPKEKKAAFGVHQAVNLVLLPVVTAGASIMLYLHHPGNHFISWHGILGTAVLAWMWGQALFGAASVWGGGRLLGGEAKAKGWWKWHRLSGYILLPAFLLTLSLGATQTAWARQNSGSSYRFAIGALLLAIAVIGALRVQGNKLPSLSSR
ncbi:unnamed protein product [Parajaminaea phylloscopi]